MENKRWAMTAVALSMVMLAGCSRDGKPDSYDSVPGMDSSSSSSAAVSGAFSSPTTQEPPTGSGKTTGATGAMTDYWDSGDGTTHTDTTATRSTDGSASDGDSAAVSDAGDKPGATLAVGVDEEGSRYGELHRVN